MAHPSWTGPVPDLSMGDTSEVRTKRSFNRQADAKAAKLAAEMFEVLMGNDVASRKDYLVKNSALFDRAALDI